MTALPRLVITAPGSGHGKTTVASGLMAAWRHTRREVAGFKVGPDYIDPGYHALATGRPGRNLDPVLCGEDLLLPLLLHGAAVPQPCEVAVIEGVMGLFDGRLGGDGFGSTAHVATRLAAPVIMVVDVSRLSRTTGAIVHGLHTLDPELTLSGVIVNQAGSTRHAREVTAAVRATGVPVLGVLPRDAGLEVPSRHLGLVTSAEQEGAAATVRRWGEQVARHLDLDRLLAIAAGAPDLDGDPWSAAAVVRPPSERRPVVAVAGGRAFTFRYAETEELLLAAGCRPVIIDPLRDPGLPPDTAGLYLGGGFPELHAAELSGNTALRADIAGAIRAGLPTVAECAGLLYLCRSVDGVPMVGAIPADAEMTPRLTLGYRRGVAVHDHLLAGAGTVVRGHEFHRTAVGALGGRPPAWRTGPLDTDPAEAVDEGTATGSLHASYLHLHWAGHPGLAQRFAAAVHAFDPAGRASSPEPVTAGPDRIDLDHHGDAEVSDGLIDFAVNVQLSRPPGWLAQVINASTDRLAGYPDPSGAVAAIATRHGCRPDQSLPTAGAAEAFTLLARALRPRRPLIVHPQFTEPESALRRAGHPPSRLILRPETGFTVDPDQVPADADLIMIGNPTNPTGALHPGEAIRRLVRPGRVVCVDEAFLDAVPGEPESLLTEPGELTGLVVIRSLTKTWGLAGLRAGYAVGEAHLIDRMRHQQVPWSVSTAALAATVACLDQRAQVIADSAAAAIGPRRDRLIAALAELGLPVAGRPRTPFVLLDAHGWEATRRPGWLRTALRERGFAVRRGDTFPGLDAGWLRVAVRDDETNAALIKTLRAIRDGS